MIPHQELEQDFDTLSALLTSRYAVSMETMNLAEQMLWQLYLAALDEALRALSALIRSFPSKP